MSAHLFKPGNSGKKPGTLNRRTLELEALAERLDCNPVEVLLRFAKGDWEGLGYTKGTKTIYTEAGAIEEDLITPSERIQAAKEAAQYLYAKKKSVEHVHGNPLEGMSPEQKLEAMKQAVKMLEGEIAGREVKEPK